MKRPRVERINGLADVLRNIGKPDAIAFLALVLYDASLKLMSEKLQMSPDRVNDSLWKTASKLRHPSVSGPLRDLLFDLDDPRPTILIDDQLRALIREWQVGEMFEPRCVFCGHPLEVPPADRARTGRRRQYCSNACRQAAYRRRHL